MSRLSPERLHMLRHYYIQGQWSSEIEELFNEIDALIEECATLRHEFKMLQAGATRAKSQYEEELRKLKRHLEGLGVGRH